MIVLRKARWLLLVIGLILIAIGTYGLATNQSWGTLVNSLFAGFGAMGGLMSLLIPLPLIGSNSVKTTSMPPPQYPNPVPPPPPGSPVPLYNALGTIFTSAPQKRYIKSGIALWLSVLCTFFVTTTFIEIRSTPFEAVSLQSSYLIFGIFADICLLSSLRGLQEKQAQRIGFLGVVAISAIGASLLLDILGCFILLVGQTPFQPLSPEVSTTIHTLVNTINFFAAAGYTLLGVSFLVEKVYPIWTGIFAIAIGCIALFFALQPDTPAFFLLFILSNFAYMAQWTVCGWFLMKRLPLGLAYH